MARAGMRRFLRVARTEQRRGDVGAGAPVVADRDVDGRAAFRHGRRRRS